MRRLPSLAALLLVAFFASSCSSSQDVLDPAAASSTNDAAGGAVGAMSGQNASARNTTPMDPALAARTRLRFDSIVGATVEVATPLTERLAARARARGMGLAGSGDPSTTHVLKGYFSTITESGQTTVLYVWDVYDPDGNRVHRINGQQKAAGNGAEGWSGVSAQTMQLVADDTVDQLAGWLAGAAG